MSRASLLFFAMVSLLGKFPAARADAGSGGQKFDLSALPRYQAPADDIHGVVRIHDTELSEHLVHLWEDAFLKLHPVVRYSEYTVPAWFTGLCAGTADLAIAGRGAYHTELKSFESVYGYLPLEIMFATGGFNQRKGNTPGVVIFVNKRNPLASLSLRQLDGVLGAERTGGWAGTRWDTAAARGPEQNIRTWGQLGLSGEWANQPIHLFGIDATLSGWSGMIQQVVFHGGDKWNPALHEIVRGGTEVPADAQIVASVAQDRFALGFSFMKVVEKNPAVKPLALAATEGGPAVAPTTATTFDRSYPLANAVYIYLNRPPGQPLAPRLKAFLAFILSREGQELVVEDGMYTPLNAAAAAKELGKLEEGASVPAADLTEVSSAGTAREPKVDDGSAGRAGELPAYHPERRISGVIRTWGSPQLGGVMRQWEAGFLKYHPHAYFEDKLKSSSMAIAGLAECTADLALMGRQIFTFEYYGIYRRSLQLPVEVEVATGSLDAPFKSSATAIAVQRDNPIKGLTLAQLDGIFGAEREGGWQGMIWNRSVARGPEKNLRTWGQLGLKGEWAHRPIHVYGPPGLYPGGYTFFQRKVLGGADTWAEGLREFADPKALMEALGQDPAGIASTGLGYLTSSTKALPIAEAAGGPAVTATRASVADRTYPLSRPVYLYFTPDTPGGEIARPRVDPKIREFLRYVLSREGQDDVRRAGDYLPLTAARAQNELKKLD
jgi:phosphate transport system substrate-binding protein